VTVRDLFLRLRATYTTPQPTLDFQGNPSTIMSESVELEPGTPSGSISRTADRLITRTSTIGNVTIQTGYYWPPDPEFSAGYTAPLERWDKTIITGLTETPIILTGYYSQTYRPEHHNFGANFLFEPALEPALPQSQRSALEEAHIKQIYLKIGGLTPDIRLIAPDGSMISL